MTSRMMFGGVTAAAIIAGTIGGVAVANPSSAPSPTGLSTHSKDPKSGVEADPNVARAAAVLGVTPDQLLRALPVAKIAAANGGSITGSAAAAALAAALGVTAARAQQALIILLGPDGSSDTVKTGQAQPPESMITELATQLHISVARARQVLDALGRMANPGHGVDPTSPAFTALASSLGETPAQLIANLQAWKMALRSTMPQSPSPTPVAPSPSTS